MRKAVDDCQTDTEDGKFCGYVRDGCLSYVVDPNPSLHYPDKYPM